MTSRILHTMLRVSNLDRSIAFYTNVLGMTLLRRDDYPEGKFTLAFLGFGSEEHNTVLELTHNWETESYELGTAFGHIAIGVEDVYATCEAAQKVGAKVVRPAGPMLHNPKIILAFLEDPDGYKVELLKS